MLKYLIIFSYPVLVAIFGSLFSRQKNTEEFFMCGRSMHWLPVAISYVASLISAISYMALPIWAYRYDMLPALNEVFIIIFAVPVMVLIFLPLYRRIGVVSIYEYLENRYSLSIRMIGSILFLLQRFVWMGMVIYVPAVTLNYLTGIALWKLILLMGILTTIYTCLGGMKAVIWVDVVQFVIMFLGIMAVLFIVASKTSGGLLGALNAGVDLGKIKFVKWELTWQQPNTWLLAVGAIFGFQNFAADQIVMQRFLTAKSLKGTILSFLAGCGINYIMVFLMYLVGAFLFVFYSAHPELGSGIKEDFLFPNFINTQMPEILGALVIAAIMAASMSCVNAGLNSMTAVIMTDYYTRLFKKKLVSEDLKLSRLLTIALGIAVIIVGLLVQHIGTNILDIILYTAGWFMPPISAIFLLGAITKRTNVQGALLTMLCSPAIMIILWYVQIIPAWMFSIVAMTVALVLGYLGSLLFSPPAPERLEYCFNWNVNTLRHDCATSSEKYLKTEVGK